METPTPYANFTDGLMKGYNFVHQNALANQHEKQQEQQAQQMSQLRQQELKNKQFEYSQAQQKANDQHVVQLGNALEGYIAANKTPPADLLHEFFSAAHIDPNHFMTKKYGQALDTAERVITGQQDPNSPESISAANLLWSPQVNKGVGAQLQNGDTVTGKKIAGIFPGPQGQTLTFDLGVNARTPKGKEYTYNAPMTQGRDGNPDVNVHQVPVEHAVANVAAQQYLWKYMNQPAVKQRIQAAMLEHGAKVPDNSVTKVFKVQRGGKTIYAGITKHGDVRELAVSNGSGLTPYQQAQIDEQIRHHKVDESLRQNSEAKRNSHAAKLAKAASTYHDLYPLGPGPHDPTFAQWMAANYPELNYSSGTPAPGGNSSGGGGFGLHFNTTFPFVHEGSAAPATPAPAKPKASAYKTPKAVQRAYKSGALTYQQASQILQNQFHVQP